MNENVDLLKILKYCPKGWRFYTTVWGEVAFIEYNRCGRCGSFIFDPIDMGNIDEVHINTDGTYCCFGECIIFPSKEQRDWSKFNAPWYKKDKFDPKTLNPFDRVLVRNCRAYKWKCEHFSYFKEDDDYPCMCCSNSYAFCVPYNDDTKHLVGKDDDAPEYYRWWDE